jgi:K+-transporting ATPase A subunit
MVSWLCFRRFPDGLEEFARPINMEGKEVRMAITASSHVLGMRATAVCFFGIGSSRGKGIN